MKQNFNKIINNDQSGLNKYKSIFETFKHLDLIKDCAFAVDTIYTSGHHVHCSDPGCLACIDIKEPISIHIHVIPNSEDIRLMYRVER